MNCEKLIYILVIILVLFLFIKKSENFEDNSYDIMINNIDVKKLRYNLPKEYNTAAIDEEARMIYKIGRKNPTLLKIIDQKIIEIYGEIKNNDKLKEYLLMKNMIDTNGLPIFLNNYYESYVNKIKILLIVKNI